MKSGVKGALFTVLSLGVSLAAVLLSSFLLARSEASPDKDGGVDEELLAVLPGGRDFTLIDAPFAELPESVVEVYSESSGGYVFRLNARGYYPDMIILCGIDADGVVAGAACVSSNESLGKEKTYGESVVGTSIESVDSLGTVAGATKTTRGYNKAISDALTAFHLLSETGGEVENESESGK